MRGGCAWWDWEVTLAAEKRQQGCRTPKKQIQDPPSKNEDGAPGRRYKRGVVELADRLRRRSLRRQPQEGTGERVEPSIVGAYPLKFTVNRQGS